MMQGDELLPGGQNIVRGGTGFRTPHPRGRNRPLKPLNKLRESSTSEVGAQFFALRRVVTGMVMVGGEGRDDCFTNLLRFGMHEIERGDLLDMIVQQPRVTD